MVWPCMVVQSGSKRIQRFDGSTVELGLLQVKAVAVDVDFVDLSEC